MAEAEKKGKFARLKKWFREMKSELKKVVWPSGKQVLNNSLVVVACVVIVGLIVGLLDFGAGELLSLFLKLF